MLTCVWLAIITARAQTTAAINIQASQPGAVISSNLFGIFFEEINYGGEGGVYAELVRNRAFYDPTNALFWTLVTQGSAAGTMAVDATLPLNTNTPNALKLTMQSGTGSVGAGNSGFWGIALQAGAIYDLNFYAAAANGFSRPISARLESADGSSVYAQAVFSGLTANWQKYSAALVASGTDTNARLVLSISNSGAIWLDEISLFPHATFNHRTNGLRLDLVNMLADLKPSFLRFPGGKYNESYNVANAVRWKKSIGELASRPGHLNDSWGYWSTDGFGAHEFFQFCEDLGMEPLYDVNCGLMLGYNGSTNNTVPLAELGPWVQDALDIVEYANGDTNMIWGAARAANGHPAPFNLKYLEIGNENGGPLYDARYTLFYDALKANYPSIKLISPVWDSPSSPVSRPVEIRDEHYYSSPATFISYATKYDSYSRSGPKVFVGEYAVTSGYGTYGNLSAALGEAAFMTGLERNADVVQLASYAPLFANVNGIQWHPDLIYYDSSRCFGTPAYYVQKLFSRHRGDTVLPTTIALANNPAGIVPRGAIGVGSWSTAVQYTNLVVTSNGVTIYQSDFAGQGTNGWRVFNGTWSTNAGLYQQTAAAATDCRTTTGSTNWANYTLSLRARKISGAEGFIVLFNWTDDNNWTWWNVGGWGNTLDGIEQNVGGSKTTLAQVSQTALATNTWYDLSVVLSNSVIRCYLNNTLMQTVTYPSASYGVYVSSSYAKASGEIVVKAVNPYSQPVAATINLAGVNSVAPTASIIQLSGANGAVENSLAAPYNVFPVTNVIANASTNFTVNLPAYSLSVLRLSAKEINFITNLFLQIPSPILSGQLVASTVWGKKAGSTNWLNLSTNSSYGLVYSSANTNLAVVDSAGKVTGLASGAVDIVATYAALGLAATQTVQVISVPTTLVHRYSFNDAAGSSTVLDSAGGTAWNGTLPSGGTLANGQLACAAASKQFLQLPAGVLSNYAAVTIEAWVTFPNQIPNNSFFFGFGNTNGAAGVNYIFCAPRAGRIAISSGTYSSEQNAYGNLDFSLRTNLQVTAVFNPPAGYVALYTNGVLAGLNNAVTVSFSSVSNLYSWVGRSLYSPDPYPDFSLDEFRIYNGALSASEISATHALGARQVLSSASPLISNQIVDGNLTLTWPLANAGYTLMSRTNLASGNWLPVATPVPQISGGQWQVMLPAAGNIQFYQLRK